jgi:hypothetical protein
MQTGNGCYFLVPVLSFIQYAIYSSRIYKTILYPKIPASWDVVPCSLVRKYQCFGGTYCLRLPEPEGGGSKFLCNIGTLLPDYMTSSQNTTVFILTTVATSHLIWLLDLFF